MNTSVIFLNGPTCVGKTSIAKDLQAKLSKPFLLLSIDMMIDMMPDRTNNWHGGSCPEGFSFKVTADSLGQLATLQVGPYAEKVCESLKSVAVTLLNEGHNLIIDEICLIPNSFASFKQKLVNFNALYVGLSASLATLQKRENARPDRMQGSARAQYALVHQGNSYDIMLDTEKLTVSECSDKIIKALMAK